MTLALVENTNNINQATSIKELIKGLADQDMLHLPLDAIQVREGFNPRRYFDPTSMNELVESVKAQGIIQPLVVKPSEDKSTFYLIAGERRFRASHQAKIDTIPVIVRLVDDETALAMALAENSERDDTSAIEDAKACQRMLDLCKGDRDEATRSLGWTRKKFDSRLSLLHCSDAVQDALEQRKIKIGHAELLAGLSKSMQDQTLPGIIDNKVSVHVLRDKLGFYAYKLSDAVFDANTCAGCPHNSGTTSDLFDTGLGNGHCMNRDCYHDKTQAFLVQKKETLAEQYPVIWLDVEKAPDTRCHLVREGENSVGKEQFSACQGCAKFGALMLTEKGKEGQIEEGICFDTGCNKKKVAAYKKELSAVAEKPAQTPTSTETGTKADKSTAKTPKDIKTADEAPKKVQRFVNSKHYDAAATEVSNNVQMVKIFSLIALSESVRNHRNLNLVKPLVEKHGAQKLLSNAFRADTVKDLAKLDDAAMNELIRAFTATMAGCPTESMLNFYDNDSLKVTHTVLNLTQANMQNYFIVDKEYLETLTISGLKALCEEAGLIEWYDDKNGKGACYKNVLRGQLADQRKAILDAGFDWTGFIPKAAALPKA